MLRLELYSPEELGKIVLRSAGLLHTEIEADGAGNRFAFTGDPRIANRLLKRVRDFAQVMSEGVVTLIIRLK